jgi:hypothetical protein
MKALIALLAISLGYPGLYQSIGPGLCSSNAVAPGITFSYSGGNVTLGVTGSCTGKGIFYNIGTETPTIASTYYTAPFAESSGTVITAMCATVGAVADNIDLASTNWKVCTANGTGSGFNNGTPNSTCSGGVGTNQPSTWAMVWNPFTMSVSTTATSGQTAILVPYNETSTVCDTCTEVVVKKTVEATADKTIISVNESDILQYDATTGTEHMGGFQCNQQGGTPQWQYDNVGGAGWQNFPTAVTDHCPWVPGTSFVFEAMIHWVNGDTGCGGLGCIYYDWIRINGTQYNCAGCKLEAASTTFHAWGTQEQIGLYSVTTTGINPTVGGRNLSNINVALGFQDESSYTSYTVP